MQNLYSAISVSSMAIYNNCNSKMKEIFELLNFDKKIYTVTHFDLLK